MLYTVIDHATKELTDLPTPADHDYVPINMCSYALTPDPASNSTVVRKSDGCNEVAIVATIVSVIIISAVVICIVIIVNSYCLKREKNDHT